MSWRRELRRRRRMWSAAFGLLCCVGCKSMTTAPEAFTAPASDIRVGDSPSLGHPWHGEIGAPWENEYRGPDPEAQDFPAPLSVSWKRHGQWLDISANWAHAKPVGYATSWGVYVRIGGHGEIAVIGQQGRPVAIVYDHLGSDLGSVAVTVSESPSSVTFRLAARYLQGEVWWTAVSLLDDTYERPDFYGGWSRYVGPTFSEPELAGAIQ